MNNKNTVQLRRIIRHHAIHHMLYTISLLSNMVVIPIYWGFMHKEEVRKARLLPDIGEGRAIHLTMIHSFPMIASIVNIYCTNCILKVKLCVIIIFVAIAFSSVQFYLVVIKGDEPNYFFMTFNDGA